MYRKNLFFNEEREKKRSFIPKVESEVIYSKMMHANG